MALRGLVGAVVFAGAIAISPCTALESRTALVIGNGSYSFGALPNAVNDATDVGETLRSVGFDVSLRTNADQRSMLEAIDGFGAVLKEKRGVGLFYFSGHGVQLNGANYMLPAGNGLSSERDLRYRAVNASEVLEAMAAASNQLNIVILDACRNNPFPTTSRSVARGLARLDSTAGTFISFSTSPGAVALDGDGRNSPYTKHLLAAIRTPDLTIEETFKRTLKGVYQETAGQQTPWISSSFFGDFVFRPAGAPAAQSSLQATPQLALREVPSRELAPGAAAAAVPALTGVYRVQGTNPNGSRYRGMVSLALSGKEYEFKWWIGQQVFNGKGRFAGRMLVVDWGSSSPVIYTLHNGARLDGEWADGRATESLEVFARAAPGAAPRLGGRYQVSGRSPNGSSYSGGVTITSEGSRYRMNWRIGSSSYQGTGTLNDNVLTVDWGSATPVVYAVSADGRLRGLWAGGNGEETLTPER
jgi:hypothetical protein